MADNNYNECDMITLILGIALFAIVVYLVLMDMDNKSCKSNDFIHQLSDTEKFGALQSLYSNDGIEDAYLTIENDPDDPVNHDPYAYWRGLTWNLPTRNLNGIISYPYLYESM